MDELHEFCERMLGDRDAAARAAAQARQGKSGDRVPALIRAVAACRSAADVNPASPSAANHGGSNSAPGSGSSSGLRYASDSDSAHRHDAEVRSGDESGSDSGPSMAVAVAAEVAAATARLPQRQREALALRESLRLSHSELAEVIGMEPVAVAPLLARARLRLHRELRGNGLNATGCPERDRALRTIALRQDHESVPPADDDWLLEHVGHCMSCGQAHGAMLEASVRYRAWRVEPAAASASGERVSGARQRLLRTSAGELRLGGRPWLMGIVNATPDSFSDGGTQRTLDERVELARTLLAGGAEIIDIGGESGVTNRPAVPPDEEIARVVPLIERVAGELGARVSVDTYKPAVARAAIAAGASIVNDVSGLRDPELADVCAETGAALVLMHTTVAPKRKLLDPSLDDRIVADVRAFLEQRIGLALARGVAFEQLMLDPGPDFAKTPAQTVLVLRALESLAELDRPLLLAVSRKDFVGALTQRGPRERLAGTLAAVGHGVDAGAHVLRVHDVQATADFLTVRAALNGERPTDPALRVPDPLRWAQ